MCIRDRQRQQQLERRLEQQEQTRCSFERITQAAIGEQNSLLLETRKRTQEQLVELKEATVTDLVNLQSHTTKTHTQHEDSVIKIINAHVSAEQAARQAAHSDLESRVASLLEVLRHSVSDAISRSVAELGSRINEQAVQQEQSMGAFRKEVNTVLTKQTGLHESAAGMIHTIDERVAKHTKELTDGVERKLSAIPPAIQELRERCDALQGRHAAHDAQLRELDDVLVRPRMDELEHKTKTMYLKLSDNVSAVTDACRDEFSDSRKQWLAQIESVISDQRVAHESQLATDVHTSGLRADLNEVQRKLPELIGALEDQTEFNLNLIPPKLSELREYVDEQIANLRSEEDQHQQSLKLAVSSTEHRVQKELSQIKHHTVAEMAAIASGQVESVEKMVHQRTALMSKEMEALKETTSMEVALKGFQFDSKLKTLRSELGDHTASVLAEEHRRSRLLDSKVDQMSSTVHKLREDTVNGMEAVVVVTNTELSKTEAKLLSMVSQHTKDTESVLGDLAVDVVNNRGALMDLKKEESDYHHSVELVESKQLSMEQQLHQFKREAFAEVEAIKRASERRRLQQERSNSRPRD
eukprot:TRINITY_DN13753_c0_g1_i1.p1 TRINITY_DN13753_c0_g1~~TRINITY_DN13753_c0_g1_i1.p1  ORF type:complete len:584 (-),score=174.52 TRINITY_DN13753_c0_g1_i1:260-2011(-)